MALVKGMATFVPGVSRFALRGPGGTTSARYCYAVWLCHLIKAAEGGLPTRPGTVAELGPYDSLGTGLAAMLTGADHYFAFDVRPHASVDANLRALDELVSLFAARAPIPSHDEFPELEPLPASREFPSRILDDDLLARTLRGERIDAIRRAVRGEEAGAVTFRYAAPWYEDSIVRPETVDMAFSQAVLEHVEPLDAANAALYRWLRPGGFVSHTIDFRCHGLTRDWFGHWTLSDRHWHLVRGRRSYLINRMPLSTQVEKMEQAGFRIVTRQPVFDEPARREDLAVRFRTLSDEDLRTASAFIQAVKPAR